jgi:hypothetical protein
MQDLNDKVTGGTLTAAEWNEIPSEIQQAIVDGGIALSGGDLAQLSKAIINMVANGNFYTDSGAADAYVLTPIGTNKGPTVYKNGTGIEFVAGNPNTGATTVNVNGIGVVDIVDSAGAPLVGGEIVGRTTARFDSASGDFQLTAAEAVPDASTTVKGIIELATQAEVDAGTDAVRAVTPETLAAKPSSIPAINAVGSYGMLRKDNAGTMDPGDTEVGTNLSFSSAGAAVSATAPTGTWTCLGFHSGVNSVTLMQKTAS